MLAIERRCEDELVEEFIGDLTDGMDGTTIRAGIVKVGSSLGTLTAAERKVTRAAAIVQQETGFP